MTNRLPFTIYDAAAGSGKTFTLVKEYLSVLLQTNQKDYYKYLLAITFTNKAVAEMKQRILNTLIEISDYDEHKKPSEMAKALSDDTNLSLQEISVKTKKIVKHLLHHYSQFHIETIDGFNHKLIRTFAKDLKLPASFEVFLDIPLLITEAVDRLLSKTGEDTAITQIILEYAIEKLDNDKSWDISRDIGKASKLLFDESMANKVSKLKQKNTHTFIEFKKQLRNKQKSISQHIVDKANQTLPLISQSGLEFSDFSRQSLPKFFNKLASGNFDVNLELQWQSKLVNGEMMYTKTLQKKDPHTAAVMDEIQPQISQDFLYIKEQLFNLQLTEALLKNLTPLSVINLVQQEIETIKTEKNILPISDFNRLINAQIKDQPAPFIYERLGERYKHFFIDEFQDTSQLQWENLLPLIENALSQQYQDGNSGSLLLVGDVKQSIYRWRGGLPEQFLQLITRQDTPFVQEQQIENLDTNYRSRKEIINFNNRFFSFLSGYFGNPQHQKLFEDGNNQKTNPKEGGYINFTFVQPSEETNKEEAQAQEVLQYINKLVNNNYQYKDICVLTRKNSEAAFLGKYLLEQNIPVVSPDSLLLQYSDKVQCLINTILLSLFPEDEEAKIALLYFLHTHFSVKENQHAFFSELIKTNGNTFSEKLKQHGIVLDIEYLQEKSIFEGCEYVIKQLRFNSQADAYIFEFMDFVWQFEQQPLTGKQLFFEEWELKKEKLTISANDSINGVQLMTIHKAKGLEFPVVIYPYAQTDIYKEIEAKVWFELNSEEYPFDEFLINYNKALEQYGGEQGKNISKHRSQQLELDNFNILYVAFTRAVDQLFVISEFPKKSSGKTPKTTFNQIFKDYLLSTNKWNEDQTVYEEGVFFPSRKAGQPEETSQVTPRYVSVSREEHPFTISKGNALLWKNNQAHLIDQGKIFHAFMAKVIYAEDVQPLKQSRQEGDPLISQIEMIVNHPELKRFFDASEMQTVFTERKICTSQGDVLIPDRINILSTNEAVIIDYKTRTQSSSHHTQVNTYGLALEEIGYSVSKKYLVYLTQDQPEIVEVS